MKRLTISTPKDSRHGMTRRADPRQMKHKKDEPRHAEHSSPLNENKAEKSKVKDEEHDIEGPRRHQEHSSPVNENKAEKAKVKDEEDDLGPPRWLDGVSDRYFQTCPFANASLEFFNQQEGRQYKLVEPGTYCVARISGGPMLHINFKAKARDYPGAEVETFFAQIRMHSVRVVDCCVPLGPSCKLPHWSKADNRGCRYCNGTVQHPNEKCDKLIKGRSREEAKWLYGEDDSEDSEDYCGTSDSDDGDSEGSSSD